MSLDDPRLDSIRYAWRTSSIAAVVSASIRAEDGRTISALLVDDVRLRSPMLQEAKTLQTLEHAHRGRAGEGAGLCA